MSLESKMSYYMTYYNASVIEYFNSMGFVRSFDLDSSVDFIVIPGGPDVNTHFYYESEAYSTIPAPMMRDLNEFRDLSKAIEMGIKSIGICRGAQLLCVASGGFLIQHVNFHAGFDHEIKIIDGAKFEVNSRHKQMMFPYSLPKDEYHVIGWSEGSHSKSTYSIGSYCSENGVELKIPNINRYFFNGVSKTHSLREEGKNLNLICPKQAALDYINKNPMEAEIVRYYNTNSLAIQYHPEDMHSSNKKHSLGRFYTEQLIKGFIENRI